jgi:hypothetical protein
MDFDPNTATALLAALRLAREHGSAEAALRAAGIDLPDAERFSYAVAGALQGLRLSFSRRA